MKKKFIQILESTLNRYIRNGYLVGDIVKFKPNFQTSNSFKSLSDPQKAKLLELSKSDLPLRIANIKNHYPSAQPGNDDNMNGIVVLDLAQEIAPGKFADYVTCPCDCVEVETAYPNLTPVSKSLKYDNKEVLKPVPLADYQEDNQEIITNQTRKTAQTAGVGAATSPTELYLPDKQVKIPNGSKQPIENQGGKKPYTSIYMGIKS